MHSTTLHQSPISTPSTARPRTPSPFRCPIALSSYHPNPTHDSSAPRRQLDGGGPPAADGRGGGQTRPERRGCPRASLRLRGPGGCSPRRRQPSGASSRSQGVGRPRRGRSCQQASHGVGRRCPAGGVHPSGFGRPGSGCPAVRCPVTWGRRPEGPAVGPLLSSCPVSSCPMSIRAVSSHLVSALVGPDASVSSHSGSGGGDQVAVTGRP
jgi:hypothetical protein